jgi:hypothetical protein
MGVFFIHSVPGAIFAMIFSQNRLSAATDHGLRNAELNSTQNEKHVIIIIIKLNELTLR